MFLKISGRPSLMASVAKAAVSDAVVWDVGQKKGTLWQLLRVAQRTSGCTTKTLAAIEETLRPIIIERTTGGAQSERSSDHVLIAKANAVLLQIHGCVGCHDFVFLPTDRRIRCPRCAHPRFNSDHKPNEVRGGKKTCIIMYVPIFVCMH